MISSNLYNNLDDDYKLYVKLNRNLELAKEAIVHVKQALPLGAVNDGTLSCCEVVRHNKLLEIMRKDYESRYDKLPKMPEFEFYRLVSDVAKEHKIGNCFEQSCVAFSFLRDVYNVRKVDRFRVFNADHGFVVIGRIPNSDITNPFSWGAKAVVCDPWASLYYIATDFFKIMVASANRNPFDKSLHSISYFANRYSIPPYANLMNIIYNRNFRKPVEEAKLMLQNYEFLKQKEGTSSEVKESYELNQRCLREYLRLKEL